MTGLTNTNKIRQVIYSPIAIGFFVMNWQGFTNKLSADFTRTIRAFNNFLSLLSPISTPISHFTTNPSGIFISRKVSTPIRTFTFKRTKIGFPLILFDNPMMAVKNRITVFTDKFKKRFFIPRNMPFGKSIYWFTTLIDLVSFLKHRFILLYSKYIKNKIKSQIPFMGSGTTAVVAKKLGRNYIGIELSKKYINIAEKRLAKTFRQEKLL